MPYLIGWIATPWTSTRMSYPTPEPPKSPSSRKRPPRTAFQVDSTKYYVDVVINFHGTDYDKYTVNVYKDE